MNTHITRLYAMANAVASVRLCFSTLFVAFITLGLAVCDASAVGQLFAPPPPVKPCDETLLISTRQIGTACDPAAMRRGLECQQLVELGHGNCVRKVADWRRLNARDNRPTFVYVHGNRVSPGRDIVEGMVVYRSLKRHGQLNRPIRFVIFSWPSGQIPGPIKDYLVKAERTNPVAWQLAWLLDQMPVETPLALIGYSYGTRVVSGASHLLAGGNLGPLQLTQRVHSTRPPVRAALIAAAFDADWIQPGEFYANSLKQTERLIIATNKLDPAMRFYHLSNGRGRMHALGKSGVANPLSVASYTARMRVIEFTKTVGRSHVLEDYFAAESRMSLLWRELLAPPMPTDRLGTVLAARQTTAAD